MNLTNYSSSNCFAWSPGSSDRQIGGGGVFGMWALRHRGSSGSTRWRRPQGRLQTSGHRASVRAL